MSANHGVPFLSRWPSRRWLPCGLAAALLLGTCSRAQAQRELKVIPPPDPELERQSFQMAEGFEVNLFAADPALAKPIQMNFDAQGRLWVVSSEVYPHIEPGQVANDRVLVLSDADGDGRAEETRVFADGLLIPTGIEPGDGGAYVANSTELVHFRDTDGDGRADQRRVVLSGFGTEDTHHILHTFRWGPDGHLYFNQSIYIHSHIETPHGVRRLGGGGVWRLRPESLELAIFIRGLCNPWGHHFDRYGQSFGTDGAGGEGINYFIPGGWYFTAPGAERTLRGLNPGSPKHCGLEIVGGSHLPSDWQGVFVTNDFRANRVCRFAVGDDGAGFASREMSELIKSNHVGFRPVDVKQGPDGAIYIADWYNPIIQHGEVDFRDPRRDHTHGRIWRVTAKGRPLVPRPPLVSMTNEQLATELASAEPWNRHFAKRVLKERGREVLPAVRAWAAGLDRQASDWEACQLEALWVHQALDVPDIEWLRRLLAASDGRVRAAATRVLSDWLPEVPDPHEVLAKLVADPEPRVRLEAVRTLGRLPEARSLDVALRALDLPRDQFLDYALWLTCRDLESPWTAAVERGELLVDQPPERLIVALEAIAPRGPVRQLLQPLQTGQIPPELEERAIRLLAGGGGAEELGRVLDVVLGARPAEREASLLGSLVAVCQAHSGVVPAGDLARLGPLVDHENPVLAAAAARAVGIWKVTDATPRLVAAASSERSAAPLVVAAVEALADLGGEDRRAALVELVSGPHPVTTREAALVALARLDTPLACRLAVDRWNEPSAHDPTAVLVAILSRKDALEPLRAALEGKTIRDDVAKRALRVVRSQPGDTSGLIAALSSAGGLGAGPKAVSPEELAQLVAAVAERGDPVRGEAIFRRTDQACLKCHAIAGAGGRVGPDLISIGATAQVDYLLESILVPSKAIKENYHATVIATDDGRVLSGIPVRESATELVLRDAEDRELTVPKGSIDERGQGASLMPAGLVDELTRDELLDLTRFLSELGKVGPYAVGQARVVRRWQRLEPTPEAVQLLRSSSLDSAATDRAELSWTSVYSRVSGELPLEDLPRLVTRPDFPPAGFVRFELEVSQGGPVSLKFDQPQGLLLWVDGRGVAVQSTTELDLSPGRHVATLGVKLDERATPIRCELGDVEGSRAQAQLVGGK